MIKFGANISLFSVIILFFSFNVDATSFWVPTSTGDPAFSKAFENRFLGDVTIETHPTFPGAKLYVSSSKSFIDIGTVGVAGASPGSWTIPTTADYT